MQKLISVLTPTYNYGHFLPRLLDSILHQTWPNIEMFVIDDGSTDDTEHVVEGYKEKFRERGSAFQYVRQENQGQSAAVNNGLKLIRGDYLVWPDADDCYAETNALEMMATTLDDTTEEIGHCRARAYYVDRENLRVTGRVTYKDTATRSLFEDCLFGKNDFCFVPVTHMIKTNMLFDEIQDRGICHERHFAGQNWQMLLPVLYHRKSVTLRHCLSKILVHGDSHSRSRIRIPYEKQIQKLRVHQQIKLHTLDGIKSMSENDREDSIRRVNTESVALQLFLIHFNFGKREEAKAVYRQMLAANVAVPMKIRMYDFLCRLPFGWAIFQTARTLLNRLRSGRSQKHGT